MPACCTKHPCDFDEWWHFRWINYEIFQQIRSESLLANQIGIKSFVIYLFDNEFFQITFTNTRNISFLIHILRISFRFLLENCRQRKMKKKHFFMTNVHLVQTGATVLPSVWSISPLRVSSRHHPRDNLDVLISWWNSGHETVAEDGSI